MGVRVPLAMSLWWVAAASLLACGPAEEATTPAPAEPVEEHPIDLTGAWQVYGETVDIGGGNTRAIQGMLILEQDGDRYSASFHLTTNLPTDDGVLPAEVVGHGSGSIDGRRLEGDSETQLIMGMVPGEAGRFPLAPRAYGPRLASTSTGEVLADGTLSFSSENTGVDGGRYRPTRTTLTGVRQGPPGPPARHAP